MTLGGSTARTPHSTCSSHQHKVLGRTEVLWCLSSAGPALTSGSRSSGKRHSVEHDNLNRNPEVIRGAAANFWSTPASSFRIARVRPPSVSTIIAFLALTLGQARSGSPSVAGQGLGSRRLLPALSLRIVLETLPGWSFKKVILYKSIRQMSAPC